MERKGSWIQTYTGRKFWPLDPRVEEIFIEDIAHALSLICRFGGHCRPFYSVAQHSVMVSRIVAKGHELAALLHDAPEAYIGDMVRPLKQHMPDFLDADSWISSCVEERFGLTPGALSSVEVKLADDTMLATELRDLMADGPARQEWAPSRIADSTPISEILETWTPQEAEREFLLAFDVHSNKWSE